MEMYITKIELVPKWYTGIPVISALVFYWRMYCI